jgi:hypothetical protein
MLGLVGGGPRTCRRVPEVVATSFPGALVEVEQRSFHEKDYAIRTLHLCPISLFTYFILIYYCWLVRKDLLCSRIPSRL